MTDNPNPLDLPYRRVTPVPFKSNGAVNLSGGCLVYSVAIPVDPDGPPHPGVVFRFAAADGTGFYPDILFAPDDVDQLRGLVPLIVSAVDASIEAAGR